MGSEMCIRDSYWVSAHCAELIDMIRVSHHAGDTYVTFTFSDETSNFSVSTNDCNTCAHTRETHSARELFHVYCIAIKFDGLSPPV